MPDGPPLSLNSRGAEVRKLHEALRKLGLRVPEHEVDNRVFGVGTRDSLLEVQAKHGLRLTGILDERTRAALERDAAGADGDEARVEGRLFVEDGRPASRVTLRLYARGFGGAERRLGEARTDDEGFYELKYGRGREGGGPNLEVRALDAEGEEVSLSTTRFRAERHEVMNLVAPSSLRPTAPEYQRITTDLGQRLGDLDELAGARESGERRDVTLLHRETGWDARLVALAARAVELRAETGIRRDALYGLFRAGLPTDAARLARVAPASVREALARTVEAGVVRLDEQEVEAAVGAFEAFARRSTQDETAPGALSSVGELMAASGLDEGERESFAEALFEQRGDGAELWERAREEGVSDESVSALRLQGKLAYLTLNNAEVAAGLQAQFGTVGELKGLVDAGLHTTDAWSEHLRHASGGDEEALARMIPPAYAGETPAERLEAYAADMARKVRLSFPTRVVGKLIADDELRLGDAHTELKEPIGAFLSNAETMGFRLGQVPLETFVRENEDALFEGVGGEQRDATMAEIRTLQRLYQITPSDEALRVLRSEGFDSAYQVALFSAGDFLDRFGHRFPSLEEARLVYRRSRQVSAVTFNFFAAARQLEAAPPVYAVSGPAESREAARDTLLKNYPSMESLFGSLDYCACGHCRSVLSPAAYLVDLLQSLDPEDLLWESELDHWRTTHDGSDYPHTDPATGEALRPYDVLVARRPDLPHLPLTCENTHTALPYIDVVNEILEYSTARGALDAGVAHDTGDATTPELVAEPQNIVADAYDTLRDDARYPLGLPFDLWLESVRAFLEHSDTRLSEVLEILRPTDELFDAAAAHDRSDVFGEVLGLSPVERGLFTDDDPLSTWFELYGYDDEEDALAALTSAKTLARRLGVSYEELAALVRTRFLNPRLGALAVLRKLDIEAGDVFRYEEHPGHTAFSAEERAAFEARLDELSDEFEEIGFDARAWLDGAWDDDEFDDVLVLAAPDAGCSFEQTTLQCADGSDAVPLDFHKLNLFVRLWRKLGWTIRETDEAVRAFWPGSAEPPTAANLDDALRTVLVCLAHLKTLDERVQVGGESRRKLLTIWSDLTTGDAAAGEPLYDRLFLSRSVLKTDRLFDHPLGQYLRHFDEAAGEYRPFTFDPARPEDVEEGNVGLEDHLLAVQAALGVTADDVRRILADAGGELETAPLTLANVSRVHRYALLARALGLSVRELITLKGLSGLDPFHALPAGPMATLADDVPFTQTLAFVETARRVESSGLEIEDLDYLLRHRFDPVGEHREKPAELLGLVRTLAAGLRRIAVEHAVPDDAAALTDDVLREKTGLVLPADVVGAFLAMWTGTAEYEAAEGGIAPGDALDPTDYAEEPDVEVTYDEVRQEQRLLYRGVLMDGRRDELAVAHPGALFGSLLDDVRRQARGFFRTHLGEFLDAADYEALFAPVPDGLTDAQVQDEMRARRARLAGAFLPYLRRRLERRFVVQTLSGRVDADPGLVEALLTDEELLEDPAEPDAPLVEAFLGLGARGATATFFAASDGSGDPVETRTAAELRTAGRPDGTGSARFKGYLEVPASGAYRFFARLDEEGAAAELRFHHLVDPVLRGAAAEDDDEISDFVELECGVPHRFTFDVRALGGGDAGLMVQGEGLPRGGLARLTLYPRAAVERASRARVLLGKVLRLTEALGLGDRELRHLVAHAGDFGGLDLGALPTRAGEVAEPDARAAFAAFRRLAGYAELARELAGGGDELIDVFENARRTFAADADPAQAEEEVLAAVARRMADLTRRDAAVVRAAAGRLGYGAESAASAEGLAVEAPDFAHERGVKRLWDLLRVVERLGVSVDALSRWSTPSPDASVARDIRDTLKARYEREDWLRVARPIFDGLRQKQRDALVAHLMHREGYARQEQLYERFLVDPGMEPVVRTSRLRLAIASVQLFIQRCLLNLEPRVHPSMINAAHWRWMKRYRVWEANRKIFLFPENWLEPEFRDDKTHLVEELEGELLKGDVSDELAEDAFFAYLRKLEDLARLEIVTSYLEEKPDPSSNTLHVVGRTYGKPHQYFYRRYAHGTWTPWEPVSVEIEGDHVVAVVWRDRLHLFWVTFLEKNERQGSSEEVTFEEMAEKKPGDVEGPRRVEIQLAWADRFEGEWSGPAAGGFDDPVSAEVSRGFRSRDVRIHVSKTYDEDGRVAAVQIHLNRGLRCAFEVAGKNSPPRPVEGEAWDPFEAEPYSITGARAGHYTGSDALTVTFAERVETEGGESPETTMVDRDVLASGQGSYSLLLPSNRFELRERTFGPLIRPLFYQDSRNTFYVEPSVTETTIEEWDDWVVRVPGVVTAVDVPELWREVEIAPAVPKPEPPILTDPGVIDPIGPYARFRLREERDWVTSPGTFLRFDDRVVGETGGLDFDLVGGRGAGGRGRRRPAGGGSGGGIRVNPGSETGGRGLVVRFRTGEEGAVEPPGGAVGGVNVVGGGGLNPTLLANIDETVRATAARGRRPGGARAGDFRR